MPIAVRGFFAVLLLAVATSSAPAIEPGFTFQGRLVDNDMPVEGTVNLVFSLYDAASGGTQIGGDVTVTGVTVTNGLVNVEINTAGEFGADAFDGNGRWLEVSVDGTTLAPRQKITATPYATTAMTLEPGAVIEGSGEVLDVTTTSGAGNSRAIVGRASSTTGTTAALRGEVESVNSNATAVHGLILSASGTGAGVKGQNNGTSGYGVWGTGGANAIGVLGQGFGDHGVWAISNTAAALKAETAGSGNIMEGWSQNPVNLRFQVDATGNVTADGTITGGGADFAEMLPATDGLEPGDVLAVRADGTLRASATAFDPSVVGVYSTKPGFVGGMSFEGARPSDVPLAVVGIVPVKATTENGPIGAGDMLVASSTPGHAMRADEDPPQGTVIGKALSPLASGTGSVTLLVMMQ